MDRFTNELFTLWVQAKMRKMQRKKDRRSEERAEARQLPAQQNKHLQTIESSYTYELPESLERYLRANWIKRYVQGTLLLDENIDSMNVDFFNQTFGQVGEEDSKMKTAN